MINLFENGKLVGPIQHFVFHEGAQEIISVPTFGGNQLVRGRKEPDGVTFNTSFSIDTHNSYQLVDDDRTVVDILITEINFSKSLYTISAYISKIMEKK